MIRVGKIAVLLAVCSCSPRVITVVQQKDSVRVEVRDSLIYLHDTVTVQLPAEKESVITAEQSSHLENKFSRSHASVDTLGLLHHSLESKPQVAVPVDIQYHVRDSIVYMEKEVEVPLEVEKKLTVWQRFRLKWFTPVCLLLLAALVWIFRKPLLNLIRKL